MSSIAFTILGWILKLFPSLGPWGGPLGILISFIVTEEAKIVYVTVNDLVNEVEDPTKHPEFAGAGHGVEKFQYVFDNTWKKIVAANMDMAERNVNLIIEWVVSVVKANKA